MPGLAQAYSLKFKDAKGMDAGITYQALASKQVDVISAFATDGRIVALNLVTLQDNQRFFPPYFAAPVVRQDLLGKDAKIANLNLQVDQDKKEPRDVARAFLKQQGLIK